MDEHLRRLEKQAELLRVMRESIALMAHFPQAFDLIHDQPKAGPVSPKIIEQIDDEKDSGNPL